MSTLRLRLLKLLTGVSLVLSAGGLCPLPDDAVYGRACESDGDCGGDYVCHDGMCAHAGEVTPAVDGGPRHDAGRHDGGNATVDGGSSKDAGRVDAGAHDGGAPLDGGSSADDGGGPDDGGGTIDGGAVDGGDAGDEERACTTPCDDGDPCNGQETCDDGVCVPGAPFCGAGICLTSPLRCAECTNDDHCSSGVCVNEVCVQCRDNTQCDDGAFCNGAETCDTSTNTCVSGSGPCGGATDVCVEDGDACVECTGNEHCGGDTPYCWDNECVECTSPDHCQDDQFCNGAELCNASTNTCYSGVGPCSGDTSVCVEGNDTCVECTTDQHCGGGTPYCVDSVCVACVDDGDCSDGFRCNGIETCSASKTCLPGLPRCPDGQICRETGFPVCGSLCDCPPGELCRNRLPECPIEP